MPIHSTRRGSIAGFRDVYKEQLIKSHNASPNLYAWPLSELDIVFERMSKAIERGIFNKDSDAFKATCKELKIIYTYQAIKEYCKLNQLLRDQLKVETKDLNELREQLEISKIPSGKEVAYNSLMNEIDELKSELITQKRLRHNDEQLRAQQDRTIKELREIIKVQNLNKTRYINVYQKVIELAKAMGVEYK